MNDRVIDRQYNNGPANGDEKAPGIEGINAGEPEEPGYESTDDRADDPQKNIAQDTFAAPVHEQAGHKTGEQTEDNPRKDSHDAPL